MTPEQFVTTIRQVAFERAASPTVLEPPHGHLALTYVDASGQSHPLNDTLGSGPSSGVHDLWSAEVFPPGEAELGK